MSINQAITSNLKKKKKNACVGNPDLVSKFSKA